MQVQWYLQPGLISTLISVLIIAVNTAAGETTLLQFSRLVDGTGELLDANEIVVSAGKIVAVGKDLSDSYAATTVIDLNTLVGLPGLIDVHTHITYALPGAPRGDAWTELWSTPQSQVLLASIELAKKTLQSGITTIRDLNSENGLSYHLRALIDAEIVEGPRIHTSGEGIFTSTR